MTDQERIEKLEAQVEVLVMACDRDIDNAHHKAGERLSIMEGQLAQHKYRNQPCPYLETEIPKLKAQIAILEEMLQ